MPLVDVIVVTYNSRAYLRSCLEPLAGRKEFQLYVVDNASTDDGAATVRDLDVTVIEQSDNRGFAAGCNAGWRTGESPYVLFLNPDANLTAEGLRELVHVLEQDRSAGLAGPRIVDAFGHLEHSQFFFVTPASYWASALFLHRLFPGSAWATGTITEDAAYARVGGPDWLSGAAMLLRRDTLVELDGLDQGFFMYCEDMDLSKRVVDLGLSVRFVPEARLVHVGGASAPSTSLQTALVQSRMRYARKHFSTAGYVVARGGIAFSELTRLVMTRGGRDARAAHAAALLAAMGGNSAESPGTPRQAG